MVARQLDLIYKDIGKTKLEKGEERKIDCYDKSEKVGSDDYKTSLGKN